MHNFLFQCSVVRLPVQGTIEKTRLPQPGSLIAYECPACRGIHLVDPRRSFGQQSAPEPESN